METTTRITIKTTLNELINTVQQLESMDRIDAIEAIEAELYMRRGLCEP